MSNNSIKPRDVKIPIGAATSEDRKSILIHCIKEYPGHTENWYADVMTLNHICSRKTTLGIIHQLYSDGFIKDQKVGNSFHSYFINHDDGWLQFDEILKQFEPIQSEMLLYNNNLFDFLENSEFKHKEGRSVTYNLCFYQTVNQMSMIKLMLFDILTVLRSTYYELLHKYDHVVNVDINKRILRIIDMVGTGGKSDLRMFGSDLKRFTRYTEVQPLRKFAWANGISCEKIINSLTMYEANLRKFMNSSGNERPKIQRKSDQTFMDDYLILKKIIK